MKIRDVMSVGVRAVTPATPLHDVAKLFLSGGISGAPVVDEARLVGIVTKSDILPMQPGGPAHPRTVGQVMTPDVITLTEDMNVAEAARTLHANRVRRAPVVREGRLVGMVTQSDLLRPFVRTDDEIRAEVEEALLIGAFGVSPRDIRVRVDDGRVLIDAPRMDERRRELLHRLAASVDGVVEVLDRTVSPASPEPLGRR